MRLAVLSSGDFEPVKLGKRKRAHRTAWRELLDDAAKRRFKVVLVFKLDRAFRSVEHMHDTLIEGCRPLVPPSTGACPECRFVRRKELSSMRTAVRIVDNPPPWRVFSSLNQDRKEGVRASANSRHLDSRLNLYPSNQLKGHYEITDYYSAKGKPHCHHYSKPG